MRGMRSSEALFLSAVFLGAAGPVAAQSDFESYVAQARQSGMSEIAASHLRTYAGILGGGGMFKVRLTPEGTAAPSWTGAMCCLPEKDSDDRTELRQAIQTKRDAWLAYLKRIADKDGSGFVNAEEGRALARQIHVGLTVAQLANAQSLDELAQLLEGEAGELAVDLNAYLELQTAAEREGLTGCPALPQKWIKAQTPLSGRGHR